MNTPLEAEEKSFIEHFNELRKRFIIWFIIFLLASLLGYFYNGLLLSILTSPLNETIYYTSPTGGLEVILKVSIIFGFFISLPVFLYQSIKFVEPAFTKRTQKKILILLILGTLLMLLGITLAYTFLLPASLFFLTNFTSPEIKSLITANEYFSFLLLYLVGFGLMFELPVVMLIINAIHPLNPANLLRYYRAVIIVSFLFAAIITPTPDVINMLFLALPLISLYFLSIIPIYLINRKKHL